MNESTSAAAFATARANIYRFLASTFLTAPTDAVLVRVRAAAFRAALAEWTDGSGWDDIASAPEDELAVEYHHLFVVPGNRYVPPFESVYTDSVDILYSPHEISGAGDMPTRVGALLWGPSTIAVERAYAAAGFQVDGAVGVPPDHLGIELQFLARLCDAQAQAWETEDEPEARRFERLEREFLQAHLLRWISHWRTRLEAVSAHSFYGVLARATESIVHSSAQMIPEGNA